jgi:hypothetical protein
MFALFRHHVSIVTLVLSSAVIAGLALVVTEVAKDQISAQETLRDAKAEPSLSRPHETRLNGPSVLFAGGQTSLRCTVASVKSLTETVPLPADVIVRLLGAVDKKVTTLYSGKTDSAGTGEIRFAVPEVPAGTYTLEVFTKSARGEESLKRSVKVQSSAKVLLTTDKPLYQPGQTMLLRALALRPFDLVPIANSALTLEVEDAKGNKVCKKELKTSEHGIAHADFTLADEVNMGDYRIRAVLGEHTAEKTVAVQRYVLPKFRSEMKTDKAFYQPKETIKATMQVDYLFGKPVAGAAVEVKASTFDVAFKDFLTWKGKTDKAGHVAFEIKLPDYFVGIPLAKGNAVVRLEAKVTDTADHSEKLSRSYPVSDKPIRVTLIPEGGRVVPGLENRIFAAALYPDGSPAECTIDVWSGQIVQGKPVATLKTAATGLAEFTLTPRTEQLRAGGWKTENVEFLGGTVQQARRTNLFDLTADARDERGNKVRMTIALSSEPLGENVLLRLDRAIYQGGDSINVDVRSTAGLPTVYLDVIKSGQTMLTRALDVKDGRASCKLDLPASVFGTMEVHAYQMLMTGEIVRDTRVVYVNPVQELRIKVSADKEVYTPGSEGVIRFAVTDTQGKPAPAALGVLIVDEAVYALQEMQPGLEKVYFTLQQELLKPAAQAVYRPGEGLDTIIRRRVVPPPRQQVAQVLLTAIKPAIPQRWNVDPEQQRRQKLRQQVIAIASGVLSFAEQSSKPVVLRDDKSGKWTFARDLLTQTVKDGHVVRRDRIDPLDSWLTVARLTSLEKGFTPDNLAKAITQLRLKQLLEAMVRHTNRHQAEFFKEGKWTFPDTILADVIKEERLPKRLLTDGWGNNLRFIRRTASLPNQTGYPRFASHDVISAGPDGKFGTQDDLTMTWVDEEGAGLHWWQGPGLLTRPGIAWREGMPRSRIVPAAAGGVKTRAMKGARGAGRPAPAAPKRRTGAIRPASAPSRPAPTAARPATSEDGGSPATGAGASAPPARLRDFFPETLLWQPALITDDRGQAMLKVPFADSITTWRLTASASSKTGSLGGVSSPLRVFQDFFVDLDLPVALTQNDEVAFPVAVYNYLKAAQKMTLTLEEAPWFEVVDGLGLKRTLELEPNQVTAAKFRIRARQVGRFQLTVKAQGAKAADAIRRGIDVLPDGTMVEQVHTDRLKGTVKHTITIPDSAIDGASRLLVKVYPGVYSQLVEGVDGMLRMPTGCFEQTSSAAYPNILVVDYLKRTRTGRPETLSRAEQFLSAGYQRLLTFERPGGGFDWWGSGPPLVWLSAYGLQEFNDMAKVWPIDRGVIERSQRWLMKQQAADGTWSNIGATHGESIAGMGDPKLLLTSYVAWALLDSMPRPAGWQKSEHGKQLTKAIEYVREHAPKADNAYILALSANALASWDAKDDATFEVLKRVLRKLDEKKQRRAEWKAISFPARGQSLNYARGDSLTVETTALAALAMIKNGQFTTSVNEALTYLVKSRGAHGTWGSTQATILALKALLSGMGGSPHKGEAPFVLQVAGKQVAEGKVTEANADVMQQFDLREHLKPGVNEVAIEVKGETALMYQIVGRHFEPYRKPADAVKPLLEVVVDYDRTKLTTADLLRAKATLRYNGKVPTYQVIVDLPIPPGFTVDAGDFAELVAAKKVQRFSVTARQVTLYLGEVKAGSEQSFEYALKPKYPIKAKAPGAVVYEYYTPEHRGESRPVGLVVEDK